MGTIIGNYGGGGFMEAGSQNSPSKGKGSSQQTFRTVTIKQLMEADSPHPDSSFKIDRTDLHNLQTIGCIRAIKHSSIGTTYTVEDGTASIEAVMWTKRESDQNEPTLSEGTWAKITGSLKSFSNKRSINCSSISALKDFNELNYHFLSAVYGHLYLTRGPAHQSGLANFRPTPYGQSPAAANGLGNEGTPTALMAGGFTPIQQSVLSVFRESTTYEGVNISSVVRRLSNTFSENQLRQRSVLE